MSHFTRLKCECSTDVLAPPERVRSSRTHRKPGGLKLSSKSPKPGSKRQGLTVTSGETRNSSNGPVSLGHLNGWRLHRQWLDRPFTGRSLLDVIRATGWLYSPGCSTPYLSLWARAPRFRASALDRLVFKERKLIQVETLRGCTMLVPREQAAVALRVRSRTFTELTKQARSLIPLTEKELDHLKRAVTEALESGPASYADILDAIPEDLVRPFPSSLKRLGLAGSLWLAINLLKEEGRILKLQPSKRLDTTEYCLALASTFLPEVDVFEIRNEHANQELAAHYFSVEGPARIRDFAWWAGIHVTEAIRATEQMQSRLVPVRVEGSVDEFFIVETAEQAFRAFRPSDEPCIRLLPYRDTYLKGQREIVNRFVQDEHFDKPFSRWKGKLINDPLATILSNGQVIGIWEWAPDGQGDGKVDCLLFGPVSGDVRKRVEERTHELEGFVRNELGAIRLQGLQYGKNQMTSIRELQILWGQGPQAKVS